MDFHFEFDAYTPANVNANIGLALGNNTILFTCRNKYGTMVQSGSGWSR
jgi:hypothetical protein